MSYEFDGSTQYIHFGDISALDGLTTFSGHAWIWLDDITSDHYIVGKANVSAQGILWLFDDVGSETGRTDCMVVYIRDISNNIARVETATSSLETGRWIPVGFSIDMSGSLIAYIDGSADVNTDDASALGSNINVTENLYVGVDYNGTASHMNGKIAELAFWNKVLEPNDFADLAIPTNKTQSTASENMVFYAEMRKDAYDPYSDTTATESGSPTVNLLSHPVTPKFTGGAVFRNRFIQ